MGWFLRTLRLGAVAIAALVLAPLADGQVAAGASPQTALDVLHQLSDEADVIFAGEVVAIRQSNGAVEVEFRVDQAIRGCTDGTTYTLREWSGLWVTGNPRYRVGQRLLMLLHAPGAAGMSSPVSGLDGAIPIRQSGSQAVESSTAPQRPFVDLRWIGTKLPHTVSYRSDTTQAAGAAGLPMPLLAQRTVATSGSILHVSPIVLIGGSASAGEGSVPAQQASVDAVIGMLTVWQKAKHAAP